MATIRNRGTLRDSHLPRRGPTAIRTGFDELDGALKLLALVSFLVKRHMPFIIVGAAALTALASTGRSGLNQTMQPRGLTISADEGVSATLGLDLQRFKRDMESEKVRARIEFDQARAKSLGVQTAPSLFVNKSEVGANDRNPTLKAKSSTSEKE